jgi:hypothetical protein
MFSHASIFQCAVLIACCLAVTPHAANACDGPQEVREATLASIKEFIQSKQMRVLTFAGYSGAQYEDPGAMMGHASRILAEQDPQKTLINIGATAEGIGAVYEISKRKGFTTMGIVSTLARDQGITLSRCVDCVFYVKDSTWGGLAPDGHNLSPTSAAIVASRCDHAGKRGGTESTA